MFYLDFKRKEKHMKFIKDISNIIILQNDHCKFKSEVYKDLMKMKIK